MTKNDMHAQQRLLLALASLQSDQSPSCLYRDSVGSYLPIDNKNCLY